MSEYTALDPILHMLVNPERDLGETTIRTMDKYLFDISEKNIVKSPILFNSAMERLFLEILYNSADNIERSRSEGIEPGIIEVFMTHDTIRIVNQGKPISTEMQPHRDIRKPEFIFSCLLSGSNFVGKNRKVSTVGGKFGIGCKATNIFSSEFILDIGNSNEKKLYKQVWRDNRYAETLPLEEDSQEVRSRKEIEYRRLVEPNISDYDGPSFTSVTFKVDFSRFYDSDTQYGFSGKRSYTKEFLSAYAKHCADVSLTSNCITKFNGIEIDCRGDEGIMKYAKLYGDEGNHFVLKSCDSICLLVDTPNKGKTISFVNGVINEEGGVHVDSWKRLLFQPIRSQLQRRYKGSKIPFAEISSHFSMYLCCRLDNPKYKSQTKDKVSSPQPTLSKSDQYGQEVDICETFSWEGYKKIEERIKQDISMLAKKTDGRKVNFLNNQGKLIDAENAGGIYSGHCILCVTEGDSAANFVIKGIEDGENMGVIPLMGKFINVSKCSQDEYTNNKEIIVIKKALGLEEGKDYSLIENRQKLRYGHLLLVTDQDKDGSHIRMLFLNFLRCKFPGLLTNFIYIMETPYVRVVFGNQSIPFYSEKEYLDWLNDSTIDDNEKLRRTKAKSKFYKGLGTSGDDEIIEAFSVRKVFAPIWDEHAEKFMEMAFDNGFENARKEWVLSWNSVTLTNNWGIKCVQYSITDMILNSFCDFSHENTSRSISHIADGLKECKRKTIASMREISHPKKVSQIKGIISDTMHYRYGEESLYGTIVGLGNYCVGTNNLPLISAIGQFDSRKGAKSASADRYISAVRSPVLKYIIRSEDDIILEYKYENGDRIEPKHYYSIIPIWMINKSTGIATGFSSDIPNYSLESVMKYISWWIKCKTGVKSPDPTKPNFEKPPTLIPYYEGYQGEIYSDSGEWYMKGSYEILPSRKTVKDIRVTEIPANQTIDTYVKFLEELKNKPLEKNFIGKGKPKTWIESFKVIPKNIRRTYKGRTRIEVVPNIIISKPLCIPVLRKSPEKALRLVRKISDNNITLLNENGSPVMYGGKKSAIYDSEGQVSYYVNGVMNAMNEFCRIRYNAYELRIKKSIEQWEKEIESLLLKQRYILDIIEDNIQLRNSNGKLLPKKMLVDQIVEKGYPEKFGRLAIYVLTEEGYANVQNDIRKLQEKIAVYQVTTPSCLWLTELEQLWNNK